MSTAFASVAATFAVLSMLNRYLARTHSRFSSAAAVNRMLKARLSRRHTRKQLDELVRFAMDMEGKQYSQPDSINNLRLIFGARKGRTWRVGQLTASGARLATIVLPNEFGERFAKDYLQELSEMSRRRDRAKYVLRQIMRSPGVRRACVKAKRRPETNG